MALNLNLGPSYLITTVTLSKVSLMQGELVLFKVINVLRKHLTSQLALRKQQGVHYPTLFYDEGSLIKRPG